MDNGHRKSRLNKLAYLKLKPSAIDIIGPKELVGWITNLKHVQVGEHIKHQAYEKYLEDWYVICSKSKKQIPLNNLKYWNVETQEVYYSAEFVPLVRE